MAGEWLVVVFGVRAGFEEPTGCYEAVFQCVSSFVRRADCQEGVVVFERAVPHADSNW